MAAPTPMEEQSAASSSQGKDIVNHTSLLGPQGSTLTTIATELRLKIFGYLSRTEAKYLLCRRAGIDDDYMIKNLTHAFDYSILFTCRKLYQEALPIFYASQTFHHSSTTGGLPRISNDWRVRKGPMPYFSDKMYLMVNLSMDLDVNDSGIVDAVLSKQIMEFAQQCPQLRTLTIYLWNGCFPDMSAESATGSVLRQLRPCFDSFSILAIGHISHKALPTLRLSIAPEKYWTGQIWSDQGWSLQRPSNFNTQAMQWPYLILPSRVQGHISRAFLEPSMFWTPSGRDYICKWTCQRDVME